MRKWAFLLISINEIIVRIYSSEYYQFYSNNHREVLNLSSKEENAEFSLVFIQNALYGSIITIVGNASLNVLINRSKLFAGYSKEVKPFKSLKRLFLRIIINATSVIVKSKADKLVFKNYLKRIKHVMFGPFQSENNSTVITCYKDIRLDNVSLYLDMDPHDQCYSIKNCPYNSKFDGINCVCDNDSVFIDNYCVEKICLTGSCRNGVCIRSETLFTVTCKCKNGYVGINCNCPLNACNQRGNCSTQLNHNGFKCSCEADYFGQNCQHKYNCQHRIGKLNSKSICNCSKEYCSGHGICKSIKDDDFKCECDMNFSGQNCSEKIDFCKNDGAFLHASRICQCEKPYLPPRCICTDKYCYNGGKCSVDSEYANKRCTCPPNFLGTRCNTSMNFCLNKGIMKTITNKPLRYWCKCLNEYFGSHCQCNKTICLNNGVCLNTNTSTVVCKCTKGYTGIRCEKSKFDSTEILTLIICFFVIGFLAGFSGFLRFKKSKQTSLNKTHRNRQRRYVSIENKGKPVAGKSNQKYGSYHPKIIKDQDVNTTYNSRGKSSDNSSVNATYSTVESDVDNSSTGSLYEKIKQLMSNIQSEDVLQKEYPENNHETIIRDKTPIQYRHSPSNDISSRMNHFGQRLKYSESNSKKKVMFTHKSDSENEHSIMRDKTPYPPNSLSRLNVIRQFFNYRTENPNKIMFPHNYSTLIVPPPPSPKQKKRIDYRIPNVKMMAKITELSSVKSSNKSGSKLSKTSHVVETPIQLSNLSYSISSTDLRESNMKE